MKAFITQINSNLINYNSPIRSKDIIISLLINIIRYLDVRPFAKLDELIALDINNENNIIVVLYVDKMSRILISEANKIHTFNFPFTILEKESKVKVYYKDTEIDSGIVSLLAGVFKEFNDHESIESIMERYWRTLKDLNIDSQNNNSYVNLITHLLTFEPGYLRVDHDIENASKNHPPDHIDFYYSNKNTFKIELPNRLTYEHLLKIMDINFNCSKLTPEL